MARPDRSYAKEAVRLRTGRDLEALLRELFVDRRATQTEIATALGISRSLVRAWLLEYGITAGERAPITAAAVPA